MNDITALAQREMEQREKFEAWTEESCALPWGYLKKRRTYDGFYSEHTYTSLWAAWKAASMALVEALEKAQDSGKVFQQSFFRQYLMYDVVAEAYEEAKEQIAKDVEIKARLCLESNSLFDRLRAAEKRIAELESRTVTVKLPAMNDDLIAILGRPNFMCAHLAELMRKSGEDIKRKAEHEQAAVIHWFLGLYLEHGDKWEIVAKADIQRRAAGIQVIEGEGQ